MLSCEYMSSVSAMPGTEDGSPTTPGERTRWSYPRAVPSPRTTFLPSMSSDATSVSSSMDTPGNCAPHLLRSHVVFSVSTRPAHAYCHVPPIVKYDLASTTVTSTPESFASAKALAHPRPPKPAPMMIIFLGIALQRGRTSAQACAWSVFWFITVCPFCCAGESLLTFIVNE